MSAPLGSGAGDASGRIVGVNDHASVTLAAEKKHAPDLKPGSKQHMIYQALLKGSLNRFEAAQIGDSALNSTVSELGAKGVKIARQWEEVPTRFGRKVRVLRYWIPRGAHALV